MTKNKTVVKKKTPKKHKPNRKYVSLLKRMVGQVINESHEINDVLGKVAQEALYIASENDAPHYPAYVEMALRVAFESVLPKLARETVLKPQYLNQYIRSMGVIE